MPLPVVVPPAVEFRFLVGVDDDAEVAVAVGARCRFVELEDFTGVFDFPAEKMGDVIVDDDADAAVALLDGEDVAPAATAAASLPPPTFLDSCHALARAAASARASFLLFFGVGLASASPPPLVVTAFRLGILNLLYDTSLSLDF